jgi:hypothetical protein
VAAIGLIDAGEDLSERALAGTVLAAERMTGPAAIEKLTSSSARTPGNRLVMWAKETAGIMSGWLSAISFQLSGRADSLSDS